MAAKFGPRDQFWLSNLVRRTIFSAVSAERCPYDKDGVLHPSICMYVSVRCEILVIKNFVVPMYYNSHISRAKSAALSVYRQTFFNMKNANLSYDKSGAQRCSLREMGDAIVKLLHSCCNVITSYEERTTLVHVIK